LPCCWGCLLLRRALICFVLIFGFFAAGREESGQKAKNSAKNGRMQSNARQQEHQGQQRGEGGGVCCNARQKSATVPAILPACFLCSALSCERERAAAVNANEQQWDSALSKRTTSLVLSLLNPLFLSMYSLSAVRVRGTLSSAAGQQSLP
jgi:hypothetical protein